jgi:hypothetical protein
VCRNIACNVDWLISYIIANVFQGVYTVESYVVEERGYIYASFGFDSDKR